MCVYVCVFWVREKIYCKQTYQHQLVDWCLTSTSVRFVDISTTDRNPDPADNPLHVSPNDIVGECTSIDIQIKCLMNHLGATGVCPHLVKISSNVDDPQRCTCIGVKSDIWYIMDTVTHHYVSWRSNYHSCRILVWHLLVGLSRCHVVSLYVKLYTGTFTI